MSDPDAQRQSGQLYIQAQQHEGWQCMETRNDDGGCSGGTLDDLLHVCDFVTVTQAVSVASVEFDDLAVADFFDQQVELSRKPEQFARIWLHTHPGNCSKPSSIDEATFRRVFGRCDLAVMCIVAQDKSTYARRVQEFEGGVYHREVLKKLTDVLDLKPGDIAAAIAREERDYNAWLDEPITPYLVVRLHAVVHRTFEVPEGCRSQDEAIQFAQDVLKEFGNEFRAWLCMSRRDTIHFNKDGSYGQTTSESYTRSSGPYVTLKGNKVTLPPNFFSQ